MEMTEFISWEVLGTYGGALAMVMLLTQFTKGVSFVKKIPTQFLSYIFAFIILICAEAFAGELTLSLAAQSIFNAAIISMASNGVYMALASSTGHQHTDGELLIDTSDPNKDIYRLDLGKTLETLSEKKTITLTVHPGQDLFEVERK